MSQQVKITKERQSGLLSLSVTSDELLKSGKVGKRYVRQDTKEIAIIFARMNKVGEKGGMSYNQCSDLLGVPYKLLQEWMIEDTTLKEQSETEYLERLNHREKIIMDSLFNPIDLAFQELQHRLLNKSEEFTNTELIRIITTLTQQYMSIYTLRLSRQQDTQTENNKQLQDIQEFKNIVAQGMERLVIDQQPETVEKPDTQDTQPDTNPKTS